jgi:hypothetical protein
MKLSEIHINPNNPRIIKDDRFKKLVQSISEFPKMMYYIAKHIKETVFSTI